MESRTLKSFLPTFNMASKIKMSLRRSKPAAQAAGSTSLPPPPTPIRISMSTEISIVYSLNDDPGSRPNESPAPRGKPRPSSYYAPPPPPPPPPPGSSPQQPSGPPGSREPSPRQPTISCSCYGLRVCRGGEMERGFWALGVLKPRGTMLR